MNKGGIHDYCQNSRFCRECSPRFFQQKLVKIAVELKGADATYLDFRDLPLPLWCGLEEAEGLRMPSSSRPWWKRIRDSFLPRIQQFDHPTAENAIDWASRSEPWTPLVCFKEKIAVLMSASPGNLGGLRGLVHVRSILGNIGVLFARMEQLGTLIKRLMRMAIWKMKPNRQVSQTGSNLQRWLPHSTSQTR